MKNKHSIEIYDPLGLYVRTIYFFFKFELR